MKLEDVKEGMKVRLLGKHGLRDDYDDINDWFDALEVRCEVQQIKKQGYGIVSEIKECGVVWVVDSIGNDEWCFLSSDLEPYEEPTQTKLPKEWLFTPSVICTTRNGKKFIVISNNISMILDNSDNWNINLNLRNINLNLLYDENLISRNNCPDSDIVKITYGKETVYERKEEVKEMTIDEIEKIVGSKIKIVNNK